jgi:two-component system, OmpR family, response regulator
VLSVSSTIRISDQRVALAPPIARNQDRLVLVVEDDPDIQSLVVEHLIAQGFDVCVAADGEAAMRIARERSPGLLCLDLNLPRMSGYDVCEQIRTDLRLKDISILMTSARNSLDIKAFALEAGADAALTKPYRLPQLAAEIERLFGLRESNLMEREPPESRRL